jgi:hypothetical protein
MIVGIVQEYKQITPPGLFQENTASKPISTNVTEETAVFSLNKTNVIIKQPAKHVIIVLRKPIALTTNPK